MNHLAIRLAAVALLATSSADAPADLAATMKVAGHQVEIQVRHKDGRPAAAISVRLLYGRQLTAAVARTDDQGRCVQSVAEAGAYEAVIETGPNVAEAIRLPFTVLDAAETSAFPWITAIPALFCILGAA